MKRAEVITRWVKLPMFGVPGQFANEPELAQHHSVRQWVDVTAQASGEIVIGDLLILQVVADQTEIAGIEACPKCHILWSEPLQTPGDRNRMIGTVDHAKLRAFIGQQPGHFTGITTQMTRHDVSTRLKASFRRQGGARRQVRPTVRV